MDYLFPQKNAPLILSRHLRQLIETIGETKTKQQEDLIIKAQIQKVKEQLHKHVDPADYPDIMVKLIYFETLGHNTSFARILPINLCQSKSPYLKKISYLLAAMLIQPGEKLAFLMQNTILKDLASQNVFTVLTVLTMLRYFLNEDLIIDMMSILRPMLKHKLAMVRRKCILVMYNIYQKYPHLIDDIKDIVIAGLSDPEVPALFAAVSVLKPLVVFDPVSFKGQTEKLVDILGKIIDHKYPPEYDYHRVPAPWMQIDILRMLERLGHNDISQSKLMYDILQKCMRRSQNLYMHFSKGIMQQCIKTISNIYPHEYLLEESQSALDCFFREGNNNIKSFGLYSMIDLAKVRPQVLQKWQMVLIECLESDDITLAERTINLLIEIANEDNTEVILNRIISLTERSTDPREKGKLIKNGIYLIERFSNEREIFLRRMNEIFYKFEEFVSEGSINNFLKTLLEMVELDPTFIDMLVQTYIQILQNFRNSALVKVSVWIIGEMSHRLYLKDKNSEAVDRSVDAILSCAKQFLGNNSIVFVIVVSLMKLSPIQMTSRHDKIKQFLKKVESQPIYSEFIRLAKYSKALFASCQVEIDPKMRFLNSYVEKNYEQKQKKDFLISKNKFSRMENNDLDLLNNDSIKKQTNHNNIFEFKPGHRWGAKQEAKEEGDDENQSLTKKEFVATELGTGKNQLVLRGPHQEKKSKNLPDERKAKLAKSIFGAKIKRI